jgi:VCBS repeat-containing protein
LVNHGDGTFTYTPNPGFGGSESFVYEICDTAGKCDTATVSIQVGSPPVATHDSAVTPEDLPVTIDVAANDSDPEGGLDPTSANTSCGTCSGPSNGTLGNNGNGTFDYTPSPDFSGADSFVYEICDTTLLCDTATVTVTVNPVNDPPVSNDDAVSTPEDTPVTIDVSANDTDVDGDLDPTSANVTCANGSTGCSGPANGTLVNNGDGTFDYTPDPGSSGTDTFVYEICDATLLCDIATATVAVGLPTVLEIRVGSNSDDAEESLADGSISLGSSDLELIQEPDQQIVGIRFVGVDVPQGATIVEAWVQFQVDETTSITTTLTIQGEAVDDAATFSSTDLDISSRPRTAVEQAVSWSPPSWLTVGEAGPDQKTPDIAPVIQEIVSRSGWSSGNSLVVIITGSGERTAESYDGDPVGAPLLHVEYVESSLPVAHDDAASTPEGVAVAIDVAANDTDPDGNLDPATTNTTCATCTGPSNGTLDNNGDGTFTYTPNPSYNGPDSFVYEICDTDLLCDTAMVSIAVGDPPVANDDDFTTDEDTTVLINVAGNDTDADGNLDVTTTNTTCGTCSGPANGTLVNNGTGTFDYTPNPDYSGGDSFVYEICDTAGACDTATVTVTISPVADPPVANDDAASTVEDTLVVIDVAANDTDADGNLEPATTNTTCGTCSGVANGSLVNNSDGTFTYTPSPGYVGPDSFVYEICDTGALCDTGSVAITVSSATHVLVGAGDIADCGADEDDMTADLLDNIEGTVITLGDNVYPNGTAAEYADCYDPTWGRHKARTKPSAGNHEYDFPGATGYFNYFGAAAGDPAEGWYSYDVGDWHVIVLNSNCSEVGGCEASSPQGQWLQADLAANPSTCIAAYWHDPRFATPSSGTPSPDGDYLDFWQALYAAGADVVLNGHRHVYERFALQDPNGNPDPNGIREFIVGNGGKGLSSFGSSIAPNSEVRDDTTFGVLKLTLYPTSYDWELVPIPGDTFTDSGSGTCSGATSQPPVANDDAYAKDEDMVLTVLAPGVLGNDTDADGDPLTAVLDTDPSNGTLTLNLDGSFDYAPDVNFNGTDTFTYRANDGSVDSNVAAVTITVNAVNDAPLANDDSATTSESTPVVVEVLANDVDVDGSLDPTSVTVTTAATNGTTSVDPVTGAITYTPNASYVGGDSFDYQVCDTGTPPLCDPATVTLTVTVTNDPPVAVDDSYATDEDSPLTVLAPGVLANDSDPDSDPLTAVWDSGPANGSLTLNEDGSFDYTPDADFNGLDSFAYRAEDGLVSSVITATVAITVTAVADAPVADDQSVTTDEDTSVGITLTASDSDGDPLTYSIVSGPSNGALSGTPPSVTYTPDADFNGSDSFTFQASDGSGDSNVATVSVTVNAVNDAPVADDQSVTTDEDTAVGIALTASDVDGDPLTYSIVSGPSNGSVSGTPPSVTYTPNADFNGPDSFTFQANDGSADSNVATVSITVSPVNDAPVANDDSASTPVDTLVVVDVAANDVDVEGLDLSSTNTICAGCSGPSNGTLLNNGDGTFDYTPAPSYTGGDSFVYEICDNDATTPLCDTATVAITVSAATTVLVGAGDIVDCFDPDDEETAALLDNIDGTVFTLGDNVYDSGTDAEFSNCYEPSWGRHKARTKPSVGDNEYETPGASGYFNYFGAAAGDPAEGWYSYDVGDWHVIVLNSNCTEIGGCELSSPQGQWLQADLAANPSTCLLAYWHLPRFATPSSGTPSPNDDYLEFWQMLDGAGAELVLAGHRHVYERFAPQDPDGNLDPDGIRQIIVGTGGKSHGQLSSSIAPNSEVRDNTSYGVLKLTLHPTSYDWEFIPVPGDTFTDSGSGTCPGATANQPPVANDDGYTTDEDVVLNIAAPGVLGNDSDPESDPLTAVLETGPANGTLTLDADGSFDYTPDSNFNGVDSFGYFANDGSVNSVITATVTITVTAVPDAPLADDQSVSTDEDTSLGITLTAGDVDGDPLTYSIVSGPSNGSLSGTPPSVTYTPNVDFNGPDSFTFQANDGDLDSNVATVSITVNAVNDAPVADDQSVTTDEDTALGITLTASDVEGDPLTYAIVSGPSNGSLGGTPPSVTYTPNPDFNGPDSFTFQANDGGLDSNVATVSITVNAVNDSPVANDDSATTSENMPVLVDVLVNDTDVDGNLDATSVTVTTAATNGTTAVNPTTGEITYTPNPSYVGGDSFVYQVCDTGTPSLCHPATVTMTVTVTNDPPVAVDDSYATDEDSPLTVLAPGVLANDSDPDSDPLTAVWDSGPANGTLTLNEDGSFDYTPDVDFAGQDSFAYLAYDGSVSSVITATVTITVTAVNDSPVANDQSVSMSEDTAVGITLTASDVDGDPLTYAIVSGPSSGSLSGTPPSVTYTPDADFNGGDSFTFQANDGGLDSNVATVSITVNAVNDSPVADDQSVSTDEDTSVGITLTASDVDGDPLTYSIVSGPSNGTLSGTPPSVTYTPDTDFNGGDGFTFRANDGSADSNVATVSITVNAVNDAPVANDDSATTSEDTPLVVDVAANDVDVEGLDLSSTNTICVGCSGPLNGTLLNNGDGTFDYTPDPSYTGGDSFVYEICDNDATTPLCDTATVSITVTPSITTLTFGPTDDAYVDSKKPTANHGSDSLLQVRAGAKELDSYLKFAVSGIGTVLEAKLRLWVEKDSPDGGSVYSVSNAWDEGSLVWNNAPVIGGTPLAAAGAVVTGTWVELNVTSAIVGNVDHSFALTSGISNAVRYSSKEGGTPPELVVTFQ